MRGPRDKRRTKNRPMNAHVKNGVLTIEIGVDVLAHAALHKEDGMRWLSDDYRITDNTGFAKDVVWSLLDEAEDGTSMLTALFDKAIEHAIDNGAEHFEPKEAESDK